MSDDKTIKILFFGDMVGKPGRYAVRDFLASAFSSKNEIVLNDTFVIANVENASHGFGLTEKNYNDLIEYGCRMSYNQHLLHSIEYNFLMSNQNHEMHFQH